MPGMSPKRKFLLDSVPAIFQIYFADLESWVSEYGNDAAKSEGENLLGEDEVLAEILDGFNDALQKHVNQLIVLNNLARL